MSTAQAQATIGAVTREGFVRRGDWTKERHEKPERAMAEVAADILRLQAEHPERLTIKPVR